MALITLKPLDDGQKAVEIPKGKTVIGRGPLLGCSDKKVSRNHAVLEVTNKDEVFLTPTHVNPCFYQPTADSPGQILKKDVPCKLENGDSFSLLPRAYRYQLNINPSDQNEEGKTNGSTVDHLHDGNTTNEEFGDTIVSEKAFSKEENVEKNCLKEENTFSKRIAEIKGNDENNFTAKNCDESSTSVVEPTQNKSGAEEPALESKDNDASADSKSVDETIEETKNNVSGGEDKTEMETPESQEEPPLEASEHQSKSEEAVDVVPTKEEDFPSVPPPSKTATTKKKLKEESYSKRRDKQAAKRKTANESAPAPKGRKKMPKTKFDDDGEEGTSRQPGRTSSRTNRQTRQGLSLEDFIVSDDDEWQLEPTKRRRRKRQRGGNDSGSDWEVDHKKPKKVSSLHKVWSGSESGSESPKKKGPSRGRRKKVKSSSEVDETPLSEEEDEPQPSSSGEVKLNKTRIPCTFGKKCYRRNASHKDQFSHPGDSDYTSESENKKSIQDAISESDGEEKAPKKECPYGANCFRKNPQHKKDFKHTKTVRPQREAAKQADQKSKNCRNSDDYDLNDSFLNDDSDEYKPVDSGSDYESGEKTKKLTKVKGSSSSSRKGGKKL
nr:aprataxin and PNK-like factor [Parasteatoda tepidariorum]